MQPSTRGPAASKEILFAGVVASTLPHTKTNNYDHTHLTTPIAWNTAIRTSRFNWP